ncbi:hypothetical protein ACOSP7_030793 [Xanthoceras sorbifolium]
MQAFSQANKFTVIQSVPNPVRWKPHAAGVYKLNTDATLNSHLKIIGVKAVVLNCDGLVMVATSQHILGIQLMESAEALAILNGITLDVNYGLLSVCIESNASFVVELIKNRDNSLYDVSALLF